VSNCGSPELLPDGNVKLEFKRPWSDGTTSIELSPLVLIARLAALVAPAGPRDGQPVLPTPRASHAPVASSAPAYPPTFWGPFFARNFAQRSRACSRHASTGPWRARQAQAPIEIYPVV
jgi:hypothetical protein